MFSYELDAVFEQNFRQKLRVPPLVDPRAVEMNIFADLTISKRQKCNVLPKKDEQNFPVIRCNF
jgi:hypothetical protein